MNGSEIIEVLKENVGEISTAIGAVAGSLITAIFLRSNTSIKEFEKIKAGKFDEVMEELLASGKMTYTELYKAKNFLSVAKLADKYFAKNSSVENQSYDFDWFIRFYETVGNISDNEIQKIWAKILAGEINNPHSFSLKTIDVLKNIGKEEAELFNHISSKCFSFGNDCLALPNYRSYMERSEITYAMIMFLSELGLMYNSATITLEIPISSEKRIILIDDGYILTAKSENEKTNMLSLKQYPLTTVGRELASLNGGTPSLADLISFAEEIKPCGQIKLEIHKIKAISGDNISFDSEDLLSSSTLSAR